MTAKRGRPQTSGRYSSRKILIGIVRRMRERGVSMAAIAAQCEVSFPTVQRILAAPMRERWTDDEIAILSRWYPHEYTREVAVRLPGRHVSNIYAKASNLGLHKTPELIARQLEDEKKRLPIAGKGHRFQKGQEPPNKGLRRPGWHAGRMKETQFKKGQWPVNKDPGFYVLGALRVNADGYIDMRVSFEPGAKGWKPLHRILWEDAHGPIPRGHIVTFRNREKLDVELGNLECITLAENMRRNTIHNLPAPVKSAITALGAPKRKINGSERKQQQRAPGGAAGNDRGPADRDLRNPARSARGQGQHRHREGDRRSRPGDRRLGAGRG